MVVDEDIYNKAFNSVVGPYCEGSFESIKDAENALEDQLSEKGLIE